MDQTATQSARFEHSPTRAGGLLFLDNLKEFPLTLPDLPSQPL